MSALFAVPVSAAYHLVSALAALLAPLPAGLAAAAAVVLFTMAVRALLLPLSYYAFRGERARVRLAPQVQELYRQHGKQPERLRRELAALKAAEGTGMYAGCLPALVQLPFFSVVYRLFLSGTIGGSPNLLLRHRLLTVPLGSHWLAAAPWSLHGLVFAALFLLLALVGWASARAARRWATAQPGRQSGPDGASRVMAGLARVAP
ncbi:MAG: YidC/Oxa1 family membrane protein insertase, partial [Actinobacteria bacterium]|nr:YidC/Oxa1 family membrane protein insertase [Actinomycetota bacterium]